ncbi:MAG: hypothetical protein IKM43_03550 [Clostridia bacterium]|nr:hypothetical protein [Clostridia bacterium]
MKRDYKLRHVQKFIKAHYGYDWTGFRVLENQKERTPRAWDFKNSCFSAVVVLYKNTKRYVRLLECSNVRFKIHGEDNLTAGVEWLKFLDAELIHESGLENWLN